MTFVVVGGGPTGVELAGAIAEMARHTLQPEFTSIRPADARVILLEALDRVLPPYPPSLSEAARRALQELGVEVRTGVTVQGIDEDGVTVSTGEATERIASKTVLWAAGVVATPPGAALSASAGRRSRPRRAGSGAARPHRAGPSRGLRHRRPRQR